MGLADGNPSKRLFTIWVCPDCGYYDADPILRRPSDALPMRCFRCGQDAEKKLDLSRISPSFHGARRKEARESAPLMIETKVTAV